MNEWTDELVNELEEQYGISASVSGNFVKSVELDLPGSHKLDVTKHSLYGFILTLTIGDETGGVAYEVTLATCVNQENLADDVAGIYNSY